MSAATSALLHSHGPNNTVIMYKKQHGIATGTRIFDLVNL